MMAGSLFGWRPFKHKSDARTEYLIECAKAAIADAQLAIEEAAFRAEKAIARKEGTTGGDN